MTTLSELERTKAWPDLERVARDHGYRSLAALAREAGCNRSQLHRINRRQQKPGLELGVTLEKLVEIPTSLWVDLVTEEAA